jgi:hypothetical protein
MSVTISGLILLIGSQFVPAEEVQHVLEAIGIIMSWYGRIRAGGLHWTGLRK